MSQICGSDPEGRVYQKIISGWRLPEPPDGFDQPVVVFSDQNNFRFDWTREPENDFASDYNIDPGFSWPFFDGYEPKDEDWKILGIVALS